MKKGKNEFYSEDEMAKAIYKAVMKVMKSKKGGDYSDSAKEVVQDVLDPNYQAEVDSKKIPIGKTPIMNKSITVDAAVEAIQGDRDVNEVLHKVEPGQRSEVLNALRSRMEKGEMSESSQEELLSQLKTYPSAVTDLNNGRVCKKNESLQAFKATQELRKSLRRRSK